MVCSTLGVARYKCTMVTPSVDNVALLTHANPWEQEASLFSLQDAFWTFLWPVIASVSIPYSYFDCLSSSNCSMFCPWCWCIWKSHYLCFCSNSKGTNKNPSVHPCAFVSVTWELIFHTSLVEPWKIYGWVAILSNHSSVIQNLSVDSCQQYMRMLMLVVLHQLCMYIVAHAVSSAAKKINTGMKCCGYFLTHPHIQHNFGKMRTNGRKILKCVLQNYTL